ncbi:conserved protein, unknown function [Hepatocystis sp. ex Piliocolobus tephrosceles]|nr:conserved protein, unknown function [Hepatocystis sp. ex Piliocolobus tephrosceles]
MFLISNNLSVSSSAKVLVNVIKKKEQFSLSGIRGIISKGYVTGTNVLYNKNLNCGKLKNDWFRKNGESCLRNCVSITCASKRYTSNNSSNNNNNNNNNSSNNNSSNNNSSNNNKDNYESTLFEGEHLNRQLGGYGYPMMFVVTYDNPSWQPFWDNEYDVIPRDEFGVPASIPPEVSTKIKHTYYIPPQFYTFLKKLGDDTEELKPYMIKLIKGEFTYDDYQEMFYKFAKPLKIYRKKIPLPYRTSEEMTQGEYMVWQSAWYTYRQKVLAEYNVAMHLREFILYMTVGLYFAYLWLDMLRQYRLDMKLFYLEAPEHKINWVKPRGDLV